MKLMRAFGQQVLLAFVVLSAVFAAGFMAGTSSSTSAMQTECLQAKGLWSGSFCTVTETPE